jgi:DNA mismatch endonuclease (patch repair protein)
MLNRSVPSAKVIQAAGGSPRKRQSQLHSKGSTVVRIPVPPPASSPSARKVMRANRGRDTQPETELRSALHRRGFRFRKHASPLQGLRCRADVVFTRERVAVFVDGCFWHACPVHGVQPQTNREYWTAKIARNAQRDQRNNVALREAGWEPIRIWEHEPLHASIALIEETLLSRRARGRTEKPIGPQGT